MVMKAKKIFLFRPILDETTGLYIPKLENSSKNLFDEYAKDNLGKLRKFTVSRLVGSKLRSIEQNAYYWGVVIKMIAEDLGYIAPSEKEELHDELKAMFLVRTGRLGQAVVERTSRLDTKTFELYLQAIREWYLKFRGVRIPLPNEVEEPVESDTYRRL